MDTLSVVDGKLFINGNEFIVTFPSEPIIDIIDGKIVTLFRGCLRNYWRLDEIEGRFVEKSKA